ncbi:MULTISPECIES: serine/threonine-protein kinase [Acidiphilium]|uniref:non-specific serine/threonine protein kinase n=1 Tax=Acidiphilium rubrum TaxID=526 RepID=A0A8G2FEZ4_ACIRU|nr:MULTISPECIES: serine/threonine-protein kinase [Acidiphilium]SIR20100.1 serine/threonine protein kinase [Acidiphilium rubrum]
MAGDDPATLGKYDVVRPLGRGAMGVVFEGFDPIITRRVAIKTVRLDRIDETEGAEDLLRFKREAQAAGRLTHPNIVGVYDYGETDALAYIVMEFVEGDTLKFLLDRGDRFTPADAVAMMESLLAGIAYSHDNGVIHRDIKPANVMITRDGRVKLADFGVARIESSSLTQAGTMIGTPSYMSPEQFMGQTIDSRTDIYSAGVLLYQLLTGEKPFEGSVTAIMHKVLNTEPPPPSALSVSVAPALDAVVRRAMAKRPEDRFAGARDFAQALRDATATADDADATMIATPARPTMRVADEPAVRPRRTGLIAGIAGAALIAAGIAAFMVTRHPAPHAAAPPKTAAVARPVAPAPQPSLATLRHKLAAAVAPISCTLLHGTISPGGAALTGIVGTGEQQALNTAATSAIPPLPVTLALEPFTGPYCGVLDAVRADAPPFAADPDRLRLRLAHHATRLVAGQHIVVDLTLPDFAGYAEVDYISSSGAIYRLYPSPALPAALLPASDHLVLGKSAAASWAVAKPFGRDMILAIASSAPINTMPKSLSGDMKAFLPALKATLAKLQAQGATIRTAAIVLDTVPQ